MKKVAQKNLKVDFQGTRCYVGVDVHKSTYYVAILSEDGRRLEFSTPSDPDALIYKLLSMGMEITGLAHETGPTGYELAWACQDAGIPVTVAGASKIPRPVTASGKTDRLDCIKLATFLAKDMLKSITVPTRDEHSLREIERRRQQLVYSRAKLRQRIKSFLLKNSILEPHGLKTWNKSALRALQEMQIPPFLRIALHSYIHELEFVVEQLAALKRMLADAICTQGKQELVTNLRTVPGVGETVAHTFVAEIFRPERFNRPEEIAAYVGLAPITSHSGVGKCTATLRNVGQRYLRCILVEAAWQMITKEPHYRAVYSKIYSRTGLPQKAIVAVARKILLILWRIAVENRPYTPATA